MTLNRSTAPILALVLTGATLGAAPEAAPQALPAIDLVRLLDTPAVSGYEEAMRDRVLAALPRDAAARVDSSGNIVLTVGSGAPHLLIAAGIDEPGFVISDIDAEGYLRLHRQTPVGGPLHDQFFFGRPVAVQTSNLGSVPGVSVAPSTHILGDGPREGLGAVRSINDLVLDLGAASRAEVEALGVRLLDPVALRERAQALSNARVAGVAAQSRAGAAALLLLARHVPRTRPGTLTLVFSGEAASRYRGLQRLARDVRPDRVILLSTTRLEAASPDLRGAVGALGAGPLVSDTWLAEMAAGAGIATQQPADVEFVTAPAAARIWEHVPLHHIAVPVRYVGSPVETVAASDVDAVAALLAAAAGVAPPTERTGAGLSSTLPATEPDLETSGSFRTLEQLIETYGVSGHEGAVRRAITELLPAGLPSTVDGAGNLVVQMGAGPKHLLFVAHMDEVGYEVTEIGADGSLALARRGGFLEAVYEASPAYVHTVNGPVAALLAPRPGYLTADSLNPPRQSGIRADVGSDTRQGTEALGVRVGDAVTIRKRFQPLAGSRGTGRSIDDRVGSAALVLALQRLDPARLEGRRLTFAWSTAEEVGLVGARYLAERTRPDVAFAVDTFVSSDSPVDWQRRARVPLGSGLVARGLDGNHVSPRATLDRVLAIAAQHGIPITPGTTGGGTDAGAFIEWGAIPMPLSWPARYSHSPVELMDQGDLDWLVDLVVALATEY